MVLALLFLVGILVGMGQGLEMNGTYFPSAFISFGDSFRLQYPPVTGYPLLVTPQNGCQLPFSHFAPNTIAFVKESDALQNCGGFTTGYYVALQQYRNITAVVVAVQTFRDSGSSLGFPLGENKSAITLPVTYVVFQDFDYILSVGNTTNITLNTDLGPFYDLIKSTPYIIYVCFLTTFSSINLIGAVVLLGVHHTYYRTVKIRTSLMMCVGVIITALDRTVRLPSIEWTDFYLDAPLSFVAQLFLNGSFWPALVASTFAYTMIAFNWFELVSLLEGKSIFLRLKKPAVIFFISFFILSIILPMLDFLGIGNFVFYLMALLLILVVVGEAFVFLYHGSKVLILIARSAERTHETHSFQRNLTIFVIGASILWIIVIIIGCSFLAVYNITTSSPWALFSVTVLRDVSLNFVLLLFLFVMYSSHISQSRKSTHFSKNSGKESPHSKSAIEEALEELGKSEVKLEM